uniref:Putative secreted protein n=1 Tax=Anopheles triannulatus TaxID=58253 RepID=A0A2M4B262_9DIPT
MALAIAIVDGLATGILAHSPPVPGVARTVTTTSTTTMCIASRLKQTAAAAAAAMRLRTTTGPLGMQPQTVPVR